MVRDIAGGMLPQAAGADDYESSDFVTVVSVTAGTSSR
jgi:hypothetical protein